MYTKQSSPTPARSFEGLREFVGSEKLTCMCCMELQRVKCSRNAATEINRKSSLLSHQPLYNKRTRQTTNYSNSRPLGTAHNSSTPQYEVGTVSLPPAFFHAHCNWFPNSTFTFQSVDCIRNRKTKHFHRVNMNLELWSTILTFELDLIDRVKVNQHVSQ